MPVLRTPMRFRHNRFQIIGQSTKCLQQSVLHFVSEIPWYKNYNIDFSEVVRVLIDQKEDAIEDSQDIKTETISPETMYNLIKNTSHIPNIDLIKKRRIPTGRQGCGKQLF